MVTFSEVQAQMNALMAQLQALQSGQNPTFQLITEEHILNNNSSVEILNQEIKFYTSEIEKMDRMFSDFSSRLGLLIAIAGLLSFIPTTNPDYLPYFLKWVFWLFILAIFTYYPSSLRVQSLIKRINLVPVGDAFEQHHLKERSDYLRILWKEYLSRYRKVLWWNRATSLLIYAYILSLTASFYFYTFDKEPDLRLSIDILAGALVASVIMIGWQFKKSKTNKTVGDLKVDIATGGVPTDIGI